MKSLRQVSVRRKRQPKCSQCIQQTFIGTPLPKSSALQQTLSLQGPLLLLITEHGAKLRHHAALLLNIQTLLQH